MRVLILAALSILIASASFFLGRTTASNDAPGVPANTNGKDVTLQVGDQLRIPSIALFCVVSIELDVPRVLCNHTGDGARFQVIFEPARTVIGRIGNPGDERVFPERP